VHDLDVPEKGVGIHVIDRRAGPFGQCDGRACACDIGAHARHDRHAAGRKQSRRLGSCGVKRYRSAIDPGVTHFRFPAVDSVASAALRCRT
jgi:hypothetical protein